MRMELLFALGGATLAWIAFWVAGHGGGGRSDDAPPASFRVAPLLWSMASALLFALALWFCLRTWGWVED